MALIDRKVSEWSQAVSSLDDKPQMTAADLKAAFDSNSNQLKPAINGIIDDLTSVDGASNIGLTAIDGLSGNNVQAVLQAISLLLKNKDIDITNLERLFTADGASLVGLQPVNSLSASNVQQAIVSLSDTISKVDPYLGQPVAISQGGTGSKTAQEALYNIGAMCNENLLDNAHFYAGALINQKVGERSWTKSYTTIFDRWINGKVGSEISISGDNKYVVINGNGNLIQKLRSDLSGRTVCFSVLTTDGVFSGTTFVPTGTPSVATAYTAFSNDKLNLRISALVDGGYQAAINSNNNTTNYLIAAKLEFGTHQTLTISTDNKLALLERKIYPIELTKCQWYYETDFIIISAPIKQTFMYKTEKRIVPTIQFKSTAGTLDSISKWNGDGWVDVPVSDIISLNVAYNSCIHIEITQEGLFAFTVIVNAERSPFAEGV